MLRTDRTVDCLLPDDDDAHVEVTNIHNARIRVRLLERAIDFYGRLFGFRVAEDTRHEPTPSVVMRAGERVRLAIHSESGTEVLRADDERRSTFMVVDLDRVREILWNRGVRVRRHSLTIVDPDGHEIELVEQAPAAGSANRAPSGRHDALHGARAFAANAGLHEDSPHLPVST
jgi:catechol 2,3-dioxygenase-like lactoylglutathione lyase family enzyme